jgi:hypothetical protein
MTDNEPKTANNTLATKRVRTPAESLRKGPEEMHRNIFARMIGLIIVAVIAVTCLGTASVMLVNSTAPVAGPVFPTPWP